MPTLYTRSIPPSKAPKPTTVRERLWNIWLALLLLTTFPASSLIIIATPGLARRRHMANHYLRILFALIRLPYGCEGEQQIPESGPFILIANHSSYLDGILLTAAIDRPCHYVAKAELARPWGLRLLLKRLGVIFVERGDSHKGHQQLNAIVKALNLGEPVLIFPEGGFGANHAQVLQAFKNGAFLAAIRAQVPLLPVIITGADQALPDGQWLLRHRPIRLIIQPLLQPGKTQAASELRDIAKQLFTEQLVEPANKQSQHSTKL